MDMRRSEIYTGRWFFVGIVSYIRVVVLILNLRLRKFVFLCCIAAEAFEHVEWPRLPDLWRGHRA